MSVKYVVLQEGKLVIQCWTGKITHDMLIENKKKQLHDPAIAQGAAVLADTREAIFPETVKTNMHEVT